MRIRGLLAGIAALALVAAGCGDDGDDDASTTTGGDEATTTESADESTTTAGDSEGTTGAVNVEVVSDEALGDILVTDEGFTLYAFTPDDAAGAATCTGPCLDAWPPYPADGEVASSLDPAQFTTTDTDGVEQVVYLGWPLYTYAADAAPGDTTGQGVGGQWYAMGVDGPIEG